MSLAYSKCSINFKPNDKRRAERDYSDRSLIEICGNPAIGYSLRGTDIENGKTEIFDIQFIEKDLYKFGSSANQADEIRCEKGTYRLLLNLQSRDAFHKELRKVLADIPVMNNNSPSIDSDTSEPKKSPSKKTTNSADQENILIDIHELGESIENGDIDDAKNLASKLASAPVQLKLKTLNKGLHDKKFRIKVKIDGIDIPSNDTDKPYILNVYRSTTINELRLFFEYTRCFLPAHQYFFVNGHLAYGESTMKDLEVVENSLFVLFLTEKYKNSHRF